MPSQEGIYTHGMDVFFLTTLFALAFWALQRSDQRRRIALLGRCLGQYQIEKNMETLTQGYLRALGEDNPERRGQIWSLLRPVELALASQIARLAEDFSKVSEDSARTSKLPMYIPWVTQWLPRLCFDMRKMLIVHAHGVGQAVLVDGQPSRKEAAHTVLAELLLFQHSCHWYCKSKAIASARLMAHHQTAHPQAVAAVGAATRDAYAALVY